LTNLVIDRGNAVLKANYELESRNIVALYYPDSEYRCRYRSKRGQHVILNDVYLICDSIITDTNNSVIIPFMSVKRIDIINKDELRSAASYAIPLGFPAVVIIGVAVSVNQGKMFK
jgi:hypothetical protein